MPDPESRRLDAEILRFIEKYKTRAHAPEGAFRSLALKIFEHQFRRNLYYRKFCLLEKRSPENVKDWKEIPAMPALGFKELVLTAFPSRTRVRVFHTSGTTREMKGAHFFDTLDLYERSVLPAFKKFVRPEGTFSFYFLMPSPEEAPHSSLSCMMGILDRHLASGRGKYYVKKNIPQFRRLAGDLKKEKKKVMLLSTAFALKGFLDFLRENKTLLSLPSGSRLMETGGFKGRVKEISKTDLYAECALRLGIPGKQCVSEYGMTELSSQMYAPVSGDFKGPAWLRTLVIDPKTGKEARKGSPGILRHVDLANRGSVLAVQTEDLGRVTRKGFELLGRAKGSTLRGCSLNYETFIREGV